MIVSRERMSGLHGDALSTPLAIPRSVRGQALILLLPMLAVLGLSLWWIFDAGQTVSEKQRLVNAVDAAALSAAVWQARTLNFDAYMNRAIIANEAVIAQSVSLRSWSAYVNQLLAGSSALVSAIPVLNKAMFALARVWQGFDRAVQTGLPKFETATSLIDVDLAYAQRTLHHAAQYLVPEVVRATLKNADPRYELTEGGELMIEAWRAQWFTYTSFYGGSFRWRQQDVLQRSLDGFTVDRRYTFRPLLVDLIRFEKRGGTDLLEFETWRGLDTLSLHARRYGLFGSMRERVPLVGTGAENGEPSFRRGFHGDAYRINPRAARRAELAKARSVGYVGLPSLFDLSVAQRNDHSPPRIVVRAALKESLDPAATVTGVIAMADIHGTEHSMKPAAGRPRLRAEAAATTEFHRPIARRDGATEAPSLYNPYWRARLVALGALERAGLAQSDGDPLWLAAR